MKINLSVIQKQVRKHFDIQIYPFCTDTFIYSNKMNNFCIFQIINGSNIRGTPEIYEPLRIYFYIFLYLFCFINMIDQF